MTNTDNEYLKSGRYVRLTHDQFKFWFLNKPVNKISGVMTWGPASGQNDWDAWCEACPLNTYDIYYLDLKTGDAVYGEGEWIPWYIDDGAS